MRASDNDDARFMRRALELASRGLGRTSPNPAVGAVVVASGEIVGEGWHVRAGEPHAEPIALVNAGERARGATLYVTLEPCSHWGRTPPCTEAIIEAGISRVVFAAYDCDPRCSGKAAPRLQEMGIEVTPGVLAGEALRLLESYNKHKCTGLPFVTLKLAASLDGRTATHTGNSRWITSPESRQRVHQWRNTTDAVMVGVGTILADNPQLSTRLITPDSRDAVRVVVDTQARTPADARVITQRAPETKCIIAVGQGADESRVSALAQAGADVLRLPLGTDGRVNLQALMAQLGSLNIMSVLLEGGNELAGAAVQAGLVDKIAFFYAPRLIGGASAPGMLGGVGVTAVADARVVDVFNVERIGPDILVEGYVSARK
ncbi:MAG: bifunctional diaminohydroxyphosphoribosylaminopyrimidine deaminase/5-amino-6-(5-phosphoribosylamino)uracil reductase RibD [Armatimonadetes bacterium]|nr:bifunctional diaminohydroxyphosphoribosylaminopyrimidine deaminase/5-amino-6-(5-phosphoribosylamino)uracil reductase RibD [Armatimonadota bacterium]